MFSPLRPNFQAVESSLSTSDDEKLSTLIEPRFIVEATVDFILENSIARCVATATCARLACMWTDRHVDTCRRKFLLDRCAAGECSSADLHAEFCKKLSCFVGWKNETKDVPLHAPESVVDRTCQEKPSTVMRLIYRRTSGLLEDPRLAQRCYPAPAVDQEPRFFNIRARRANGWTQTQTICTWSGISSLTISDKPNPHLEDIDSDHESDIEIVD